MKEREVRNRLKSEIATGLGIDGNSIKIAQDQGGKMRVWFTDKTSQKLGLDGNLTFTGYATELPFTISRAISQARIAQRGY